MVPPRLRESLRERFSCRGTPMHLDFTITRAEESKCDQGKPVERRGRKATGLRVNYLGQRGCQGVASVLRMRMNKDRTRVASGLVTHWIKCARYIALQLSAPAQAHVESFPPLARLREPDVLIGEGPMNEYLVVNPHDLFAAEPAALKMRGQSGADLFVIIVCASMTPLTVVKPLPGFEGCKFDQVSHVENGRRLYRLRLGFFATHAQAEAALARIRKHHPGAFIERLGGQDKQNIGYTAGGSSAAPRSPRPPTTSSPATTPAISPTRDNVAVLADSTQTVRALTQPELDDPNQSKWYVVQLVVSDRPLNLDTMPRLEVFAAYRLYSIARQQGTPRHALRLGFFREEASAQMICGHLKTFFASPSVVRISAAEQARFADPLRPIVQSQNPAPPSAKVVQLPATRDPSIKPAAASAFFKSAGAALQSGKYKAADAGGAASIAKAAASPARPAVVSPVAQQAVPVLKQSAQLSKPAAAGSARQRIKKPRSLREELLEEARQIQMSKTGKHRVPERTGSWLSRLVGRPKS